MDSWRNILLLEYLWSIISSSITLKPVDHNMKIRKKSIFDGFLMAVFWNSNFFEEKNDRTLNKNYVLM